MEENMVFKSKLKTLKFAISAFFFGLGVVWYGFYLQYDPLAVPSPVENLIWRHPEVEGIFLLFINFFSLVSIVFGFLCLEVSLKIIFYTKRKGLFLEVHENGLSLPNILSASQFWIPANKINGVSEIKGSLKVRYDVEGEEDVWEISSFFVEDPVGFVNSANEVVKNYKEESVEADGSGKSESYSVLFFENKDNNNYKMHLKILAKLTKRPQEDVDYDYRNGGVEVKSGLSEYMGKKLVSLLNDKYGIQSELRPLKAAGVGCDTYNAKEEKVHPMPVGSPTFSTLIAIAIIPGGLVIWLYYVKSLLERAGLNIKINPFIFLAAISIEIILGVSLIEDLTTAMFALGLTIATSVYVAFGMKRELEKESIADLNPVFVALFSVPYVNHKINKAISEVATENSQAVS